MGGPDLQIRGRGGYPDPEISGGGGGGRFPKNWEKNFGRKIRWGGGRSPGSATALPEREQAV